MKVETNVKGGRIAGNHNQALRPGRGLQIRTAVKGGRVSGNHNQSRA